MKTINCAILLTLTMTSPLGHAKAKKPRSIIKAQTSLIRKNKTKNKELIQKLTTLQKEISPSYSMMKKLGGKKLKAVEVKVNSILNDKYISNEEKGNLVRDLIQNNQLLLKDLWRKTSFKDTK